MLQYRIFLLLAGVLLYANSVQCGCDCDGGRGDDHDDGGSDGDDGDDGGSHVGFPKSCGCKCGPNEHFIKTKKGEETCYGRNPDLCECIEECRCVPGYVRHKGCCIRKCDCPPRCGPNEEFALTSYDDRTCFGPAVKLCNPVWKCRCKKGYVRYRGKCIKPCNCPKRCQDPNAEWVTTKEGRKTCYGQEPALCSPVRECRCKCGYVFHHGECIRPHDCPKCCGANEVYIKSAKGERTCNGRKPAPCHPVIECRCRKGYVRHEGICIKPCDCPKARRLAPFHPRPCPFKRPCSCEVAPPPCPCDD